MKVINYLQDGGQMQDISLVMKGKQRPAQGRFNPETGIYETFVPGLNPDASVAGHGARFDRNGKLIGVDAYGHNTEGGWYQTQWPSKQDSIMNANAAKEYAPQVFSQVKKQEEGGKMATDYMQEGGVTADPMQEIQALVEAAIGGDQQAQSAIKEIMQRAQQGDPQAQQYAQVIQEMMQGAQQMKCGGKAKAKKAQRGLPIKPCKCKLARVGGKIMEVDSCTGLPYKKKGGLIQYAQPGKKLEYSPITKVFGQEFVVGSDQKLYTKVGNAYVPYDTKNAAKDSALGKQLSKFAANSGYVYNGNGMYIPSGQGPTVEPERNYVPVGNNYYIGKGQLYSKLSDGSYNQIKPSTDNPYYGQYFSGQEFGQDKKYKWSPVSNVFYEVPQNSKPSKVQTTPTTPPSSAPSGATTAARGNSVSTETSGKDGHKNDSGQGSEYKSKGFFADRGLGEYQSKAARQKFVTDNKDWLNGQGFNAEGYDYSGAQNVRLAQLIQQFKNRPTPEPQAAPEPQPAPQAMPVRVNATRLIDPATQYHPVEMPLRINTLDQFRAMLDPYRHFKRGGKITQYIKD